METNKIFSTNYFINSLDDKQNIPFSVPRQTEYKANNFHFHNNSIDKLKNDSKEKLYFKSVETIPLEFGTLKFQNIHSTLDSESNHKDIHHILSSNLKEVKKESAFESSENIENRGYEDVKKSENIFDKKRSKNSPSKKIIMYLSKKSILPELKKRAIEAANIVMEDCNIKNRKNNPKENLKRGDGMNMSSYKTKLKANNPDAFVLN